MDNKIHNKIDNSICYKGTYYCPYWKICSQGVYCKRALTKKILLKSYESSKPICQFGNKMECFEDKDAEAVKVNKI